MFESQLYSRIDNFQEAKFTFDEFNNWTFELNSE